MAAGGRFRELKDALHDLDEATAEAREQNLPAPSAAALTNARRLLRAMYRISPRRYEIYPTPDDEDRSSMHRAGTGVRSCFCAIRRAAPCVWST